MTNHAATLRVAAMATGWIVLLGVSKHAFARDPRTYQIKDGLGEVLAAEQICGFSYDQAAIEAFVKANVPKDDLQFAEDVEAHANALQNEMSNASQSRKIAYCTQVGQMARHYGFMK